MRRAASSRAAGVREDGNVLFLGIVLLLIIAGLASSFMEATVWQSRDNVTSGQRARALYVAEAGASIAVAEVRRGGSGNLGAPESPVDFGGGGYWTATVDHGDGTYTITAHGDVSGQRRAVEMVVAPESTSIFKKALFGQLDLDVSGNVFTDGYDSELGSYASQAVNVHPITGDTYASATGGIGSNANITMNGSVTVLGDATPGPGGSVTLSGGAYVDGATAPAPEVVPLPPVVYAPSLASSGAFSSNSDLALGGGEYRYDSFALASKAILSVQGDVTLYVDGNFDVAGQAQIKIENGASLTIRHGGADFSLTGGGALNVSQQPRNLQIYSTATTVKFAGNSGFHGVVYAPDAELRPTGTTDIFGSFVGRQISITGNAVVHFDEALSRILASVSTVRVVSWRRVPVGD